MKREELIVEISEAIEARIQQLAEAEADLWDCYIPGDAARQMARAAVAIMEAYETSQTFVKQYAGASK